MALSSLRFTVLLFFVASLTSWNVVGLEVPMQKAIPPEMDPIP